MGQTKGSGYEQVDILTPEQKTMLQSMMGQAAPNMQQAAEGYRQFLPGGGGGQAMTNQANRNFQQQTIPSILNSMGAGSKTSSALNQALAAGGANLNTDLASMLSQAQLQASSGLGSLGMGMGQLGSQRQFALTPQQQPLWQQMLPSLIGAVGTVGGGFAGGPGGAAVGSAIAKWLSSLGGKGSYDFGRQ